MVWWTAWGWQPGADTCSRLILVIYNVLLSALVGWCINNNLNGKLLLQPGTLNGSDHAGNVKSDGEENITIVTKEGRSERKRLTDTHVDTHLWHALVGGVIQLQIAETTRNFLTYGATCTLSTGLTLCQEISLWIDVVVILSNSTFNIAFPSGLFRPSAPLPSGFPEKKKNCGGFFFYPTPSTAFKYIPFTWR